MSQYGLALLRSSSIVLVLSVAFFTLIRILAPTLQLDLPDLGGVAQKAGSALGLVAAGIGLLAPVMLHTDTVSPARPALDRAYRWASLSWLLSAASAAWVGAQPHSPGAAVASHLSYQLALIAGTHFVLSCCGFDTSRERLLWLLQSLAALVCLVVAFQREGANDPAYMVWRVVNVLGFTTVFLVMGRNLVGLGDARAWLVQGAGLVGLGVGLNDMVAANGQALTSALAHWAFALYAATMWLLLSERLQAWRTLLLPRRRHSENSVLAMEFAHSDLSEDEASAFAAVEEKLVARERHRIAQDLHDGVGTQLVNMLCSLDRSVPQQRAMASALEQCLLDVKILVDDIDDDSECVLDALGRLRYRVQHSLDRLGIRMHWDVDTEGPLAAFNDPRSRQVLRVAQEALANVMRHSQAGTVWLSCHHLAQAHALQLEVRDDGKGFQVDAPRSARGKGLEGMRRRAIATPGELSIQSLPGSGTRIRFRVPLAPVAAVQSVPSSS
jgi:signal transduction histidine kinase